MIIDFAERAHNHNWDLDPVVQSLLDTDFYKLLMLQFIWKHFPTTQVSFSVSNRSSSVRLADVLEVYLLCLLLGFEGRFAPPLRGEAYRIMDRIRHRVETIRGSDYKLSPPMDFGAKPAAVAKATGMWRWWVGGMIAGTVLLFLLYYWSLAWRTDRLEAIRNNPYAIRITGVLS